MNVQLILEANNETSSEGMDLWKGKFITIMTILIHHYVSVCPSGRISSKKMYLENEDIWTENIFASCIPVKMSSKLIMLRHLLE